MDTEDLATFFRFFKDLYAQQTIPSHTTQPMESTTKDGGQVPDASMQLTEVLNTDITIDELEACMSKLKYGKAAAEDCITNELLKNTTKLLSSCILKLFNECLAIGVYPWNTAIVTPLHKKGDI